MKKLISLLILCVGLTYGYAQQTLVYTHSDLLFDQGKELYNQQKYAASYRSFEAFLSDSEATQAGQRHEAEFYLAANAFELRQEGAFRQLRTFANLNPFTPFINKVNLMLGTLLYEEKDYKHALEYFYQVKENQFNKTDKPAFLFKKAYAYLETNHLQEASAIFKKLKEEKTSYQEASSYYYAYAEYKLRNYDIALPALSALENNATYKEKVAYNLFQINYQMGDFEEMHKRGDAILATYPNNPDNAEVYRVKGEIAYVDGKYSEAISLLQKYESMIDQPLRNDLYYLGMAHIRANRHNEAIPYFQRVTTERDAMTENAYLHLGNAFLKKKDLTNARMSFEAALETNFNPSVREEAMFNYALTSYETNTAFGESIGAFEQFLNEFPNSKHADKAKSYLALEYMSTNNYEVAYQSIQRIAKPTNEILEAKQYVLYQLGTEAFAQQQYAKAVEYFSLSINAILSGKYLAESYFWRSESYYRLGKNENSINDLKRYFAQPNVRNSSNYIQAHYAMGYAYFSQQSYQSARSYFEQFTNLTPNKRSDIFADALNRIGDCYFDDRNFQQAELTYTRAANLSPNTGDYALFQSGYVAGLQKKYTTKISRLNDLVNTYPKSEYVDDALYEIGRSYIMLENENEALTTYNKLLKLQPNSNMSRKAALEIGMIYQNKDNNAEAIKAYKNVIAQYSGTVEAFTALQSLENIYIEEDDVASYLSYIKTIDMKAPNIGVNHEDSISYLAVERQYMSAAYEKAISGFDLYLKKYCPGGRFCTSAQFYLADSYYRLGDFNSALTEYQRVLNITGNQYMEEALMRAAEITYNQKAYDKSLNYFERFEKAAQSTEYRNIARLGILRCNHLLQNYEHTILIATDILQDPKSGVDVEKEAKFYKAKAYIAKNQLDMAVVDLIDVAEDMRTAMGAESKYLLADIYFKQNNLSASEREVLDFAKKNSPHQYWLARGFVLLSDIYVKQNNDFQAKQYLLSLQKNYTIQDDIQDMINSRLETISQREKAKLSN